MSTSIIVFSKDRPMQLHAYIESLLRYSDVNEKDIAVLYTCGDEIRYDKVIDSFAGVKWLKENNFYEDLSSLIAQASDYIMFGCDDVVFKNSFSTKAAEKFLSENDEVFGFSMRLGKNITPPPPECVEREDFIIWDWTKADTPHYDYPWELDCTLYRKKDVASIVTQGKKIAFAPNPLERIVCMNLKGYISRHKMACYNSDSKAIVITVNRVQDLSKNPFHGNSFTDTVTLSRMYNDENIKLDINKISALRNNRIHVGLEYFILTNGFVYRKNPARRLAKFVVNKFAGLIDFVGYKILGKKRFLVKLGRRIKNKFFRIFSAAYYRKHKDSYPVVLSPIESLERLKTNLTSFCRIGDGEIAITMGNDIRFQKFDRHLAASLGEIIALNFDNILVGVPYAFFYDNEDFPTNMAKFGTLPILRDSLLKILKKKFRSSILM